MQSKMCHGYFTPLRKGNAISKGFLASIVVIDASKQQVFRSSVAKNSITKEKISQNGEQIARHANLGGSQMWMDSL